MAYSPVASFIFLKPTKSPEKRFHRGWEGRAEAETEDELLVIVAIFPEALQLRVPRSCFFCHFALQLLQRPPDMAVAVTKVATMETKQHAGSGRRCFTCQHCVICSIYVANVKLTWDVNLLPATYEMT